MRRDRHPQVMTLVYLSRRVGVVIPDVPTHLVPLRGIEPRSPVP